MAEMALEHPPGKGVDENVTEQSHVRAIRLWLLAVAALVFVMVLVGGATRLTDSGLSITEWKPVTGVVPPLSASAWETELEKYRQIPEYQLINKGMSLDAFKVIYWWEWGHRFLGRVIGLAFAVPFVVFWARGMLDRRMKGLGFGLLALGGFQGFLGWYMVSSGLVDRVDVSQYRLALHLGMAALIFGALAYVWRHADGPPEAARYTPASIAAVALAAFIFLQILLGALVAGLDAGLTYTTWPLMDGALVPSGLLLLDPWTRNFGENVLTVQFVHRMGAYALFAFVLWHALMLWRGANRGAAKRGVILAALVTAQAVLGVLTLVNLVPIPLALAHQGLAFLIFAAAVLHADALLRKGVHEA